MSLDAWREKIEAEAAGESTDAQTREHLRTCDACRAHYDQLVFASRALAGTREALPAEHDALLARLNAQLSPSPARERVGVRVKWFALFATAAVAALALFIAMPRAPEREITLRGGPTDVAPTLSISVYAKAKSGGAVRLLAQFPQSGEARASESDWLQVKAPEGVSVVVVSAESSVVFEGTGSQSLTRGTWSVFAAKGTVDDAKKSTALGVLVVSP
jgi:hypothetical protein